MNLETAMEYSKGIQKEKSAHDCKLILNDMREAELNLATVDIYYLPGMLDAAGLDRSWKRAIIATNQLEDYRFFETVARNRGYQVRVFTEKNKAMNWLRSNED